jgi:incFII family plasmid replication initiator RepA
MAKAEGFTSTFDFSIHVAFARSLGKRRRMPPLLRRRAIDALLQAMCFHYDPLANRVQRSITNMAIEWAGHGICQWQPVYLTGDPRAAVYV